MVASKETAAAARGGSDWQVTVPGGSSAKLEVRSEPEGITVLRPMSNPRSWISKLARGAWRIGADDPRKVIHCMKVGLALALVSVFYYTRPLYDGVGGTAMWAVMTVVVVFDYTVGGSLSKGLNRAGATLSAGALAFGIHWLAIKSGKTADHIILGAFAFLLSSAATFSRFIPIIKARFDYGITIFILTFNLVAVSGYRVEQLLSLFQWRFCTITIGICICLTVCIVIRPVWAGEELHNLLARNLEKLAESLEECVAECLKEEGGAEGKQGGSQKLQGYKCVLNSKSSEDSLANLARWEPSHGSFSFQHPWRQYLKVAAAMRHCAYCIESLTSCICLENRIALQQPPDSVKAHLARSYKKLSSESSRVLKELADSFRSMKRSSPGMDYLVEEMKSTAGELQTALRSLPLEATALIMETLPLVTGASLLIEMSERVEGVVDEVKGITSLSSFKAEDCEGLKLQNKAISTTT